MNAALLFGAGIGVGCILLVTALRPPRRPLDAELRDLERRGSPGTSGRAGRLARRLAAAGGPTAARAADLEIVGRTFEQHAVRKLAAACALGALPPATVALLLAGGVVVGPAAAAVPAVAFGFAGYLVPDLELRSLAAERRAAFVHALSGYLDVQNAYNNVAREGIQYNFNYTARQYVSGLPILPSIGLRGDF